MGLIKAFLSFWGDVLSRPPYQNPCTNDCNQGRNCTCMTTKQEFTNWPYPNPQYPQDDGQLTPEQLEAVAKTAEPWPFPTANKP